MPAESVQAKAGRLLDEGRVEPVSASQAFRVLGDMDAYTVVVSPDPDAWFCSCPATVKCSHVMAAERWFRAAYGAERSEPGRAAEYGEYVRRLADRMHWAEVGA